MKMEVTEEIGILGIVISSFYGLIPSGMRPMSFTTLSNFDSLIPIPTRAIQLQQ